MRKQNGYIATSVVIGASAFLLAVLISRSAFIYRGRMSVFDAENKAESKALARDCLTVAVAELIEDADRRSTDAVRSLNGGSCRIVSVTDGAGVLLVRTSATVNRAVTNLESEIEKGTLLHIRTTEYPNF